MDTLNLKHGHHQVKLSRFDSLIDMVRFAELDAPVFKRERPSRYERGVIRSGTFNQTHDFNEAVRLISHGWEEGLREVEGLEANIATGERTGKMTIRYDFCGDMIDIGRHLTGQPDSFMEPDIEEFGMGGPIKRIYIDGAFLQGTEKRNLLTYGKALIPIIDAVERAGYRAEIWYVASSRNKRNDHLHYTMVKVKGPDEHLNREKLMFIAGHVDMFRRLVFAVREQEASRDASFYRRFNLCREMGISYNVEMGSARKLEELIGENFDIVFNLGDAREIETVDDVLNKNRQMLHEQGVEI